jgi:AcrR family transcriptional regulator
MEDVNTDRRVRKTKKQIKIVFAQLLEEKSIKKISVREISERADINRGTFYLHYKDAFDLLEKTENEILVEFESMLKETSFGKENLLELLTNIFIFLQENAIICHVLLGTNGDIAFVQQVRQMVKERCTSMWEKLYPHKKSEEYEYFFEFLVAGYIGIFEKWLTDSMAQSPQQMAAFAEKLIKAGLKAVGA